MTFGVHILIVGTVLFEAPLKCEWCHSYHNMRHCYHIVVFPMDILECSESNIFIMFPPKDIAFPGMSLVTYLNMKFHLITLGMFLALLYRYDVR